MRGGLPASSIGGMDSTPNSTTNADWFRNLSIKTSVVCGRPVTFSMAVLVVVLWAVTGPLFGYSDTWQLVINTGTTIVTFLMVFLIQATQNRDTTAIQIKLDELILATGKARNRLIAAEDLSDEELELVKKEIKARSTRARSASH